MEKVKVVLYKISQIIFIIFVAMLVVVLFGNFVHGLERNDFYMHFIRRYAKLALSAMWGVPMILAVVIILIKNYDNSKIPKEKDKDALSITMNVALIVFAAISVFFILILGIMAMGGR